MTSVADFITSSAARDKVVTAEEAIRLIQDGDTVAIEGFGGQCFPEQLTIAVEQRFPASTRRSSAWRRPTGTATST